MAKRIEITVSEEVWAALDAARGHEPRASFVKRALEKALGTTVGGVTASEPPAGGGSAPPQASLPSRVPAGTTARLNTPPPSLPVGVRSARSFVDQDAVARQAKLNAAREKK